MELKWTESLQGESVRSYKPRPEMFQQALTLSGLQPDEVVHVGDSLKSDILGAQSAGLAAIWLNRLGRPGNEQIVPSYACENLEELRFFLADKEFA
ncbi:HAD family hydrolase [Neobacillus mesonae]|nr:HAD family hydrolase [Neobacillus mesonae]